MEAARKVETVVIIHGTFSSGASWWRPDSDFCKALDTALAAAGSQARCWAHTSAERLLFWNWSGDNSEVARRTEAAGLIAYLVSLSWQDDIKSIHLVAHSHGGNVLYRALLNPSLNRLIARGILASVTFLGTPFFLFKRLDRTLKAPDNSPESLAMRGFVDVEGNAPKNFNGLNDVNTQCIFFGNDEAFVLLNHAHLLSKRPELYGHSMKVPYVSVFNSYFPNFYRISFSVSRFLTRYVPPGNRYAPSLLLGMTLPWKGFNTFTNHFRAEWFGVKDFKRWAKKQGLSVPRQFTIIATLLFLGIPYLLTVAVTWIVDQAMLAPIYYLVNKAKRLIERKGYQVAAGSLLGQDFILDSVNAVERGPPFVTSANMIELSEKDALAASEHSVDSFSNMIRRFYRIPVSTFSNDVDTQDHIAHVREVFTNPDFLHCQYYSDESVIQHIVNIIQQRPKSEDMFQAMLDALLGRLGGSSEKAVWPPPTKKRIVEDEELVQTIKSAFQPRDGDIPTLLVKPWKFAVAMFVITTSSTLFFAQSYDARTVGLALLIWGSVTVFTYLLMRRQERQSLAQYEKRFRDAVLAARANDPRSNDGDASSTSGPSTAE
jgi:pimeloyl-ACP methyl ester carboxylesterase